jgi:hypothetical protein
MGRPHGICWVGNVGPNKSGIDDPLAVRPHSHLSNLTRCASAVDVNLSLQGTM